MERNLFVYCLIGLGAAAVVAHNTPPGSPYPPAILPYPPPTLPYPPPPHIKHPPPVVKPPVSPPGTCPAPTEEMLRCMRQWACQYIIRLDLRCLLNLNGNPLLGNVLDATGLGGLTGGSAGSGSGGGGGGGGILGGLLGG